MTDGTQPVALPSQRGPLRPAPDQVDDGTQDWTELECELWAFLTGRRSAPDYRSSTGLLQASPGARPRRSVASRVG